MNHTNTRHRQLGCCSLNLQKQMRTSVGRTTSPLALNLHWRTQLPASPRLATHHAVWWYERFFHKCTNTTTATQRCQHSYVHSRIHIYIHHLHTDIYAYISSVHNEMLQRCILHNFTDTKPFVRTQKCTWILRLKQWWKQIYYTSASIHNIIFLIFFILSFLYTRFEKKKYK